MFMNSSVTPRKFKSYTKGNIEKIPEMEGHNGGYFEAVKAVSSVLPFRTNNYVVEELIDWEKVPDDPIFQLTFPQPGMLEWHDLQRIKEFVKKGDETGIKREALRIQKKMNPHPAGQMDLNVPESCGEVFRGMQHKYDETVLFFPTQGQTCHAYCTYCFRWAQFVGLEDLKFSSSDRGALPRYLRQHPEVSDVLFTGGDPMVIRTKGLREYIEPLINERPGNLSSIRIGTKSLAYWPYRYLTDRDSDDLMRLFEQIVEKGFHLSVMAHFSHYRELETPAVKAAMKRILSTGANIRCQAPLIRHINDDPEVWSRMWKAQVALGAVPYYMFIERDTGPKDYFSVPLYRAYDIFTEAYKNVSGLCRTVRGPSMSASPGKVMIDGTVEINGKKMFVLKFIQGRDADWVNRVFFAEYDERARWLDDLKPAFGDREFFYEKRFREIKDSKTMIIENVSSF